MKFTDGYWTTKPNVFITNSVQVREVKVSDDEVYLYIVPYAKDERAVGGTMLEVFVSSPREDIISTKVVHFAGSSEKSPSFELNSKKCKLSVTQTESDITITSGDTRLVVGRNPSTFDFYYKDEKLTSVSNRFGSILLSKIDTPQGRFMRGQLDLDIGEKVYGLGERFTPFVKNGQQVDIWNEDGGTSSEISYKNIPFYVTNKGYGVFVNSTDKVSYEICSEMVTKVQFSVPGEELEFMIIGGGSVKKVLENYTDLTGKPALPPAWTFGLWLTSSFTTSYDEETVMSFVNGMKERKIPLHVFHFDCYWMKENEWCNFEWDSEMFGDVTAMLARMKNDAKLKICVWINSYIAQKSPLFKEAKDLGYLLKKANGDVWQSDLWQSGMGIVDFTNPSACDWYKAKLRKLLDQGVDCFKTDFGERIPTDVVYFDKSNATKMHNFYTYQYNKCVFELLEEYKGKNEACLFARSATAGGQKFPVHWGGDCSSNYMSMNESLRGGLSLCLSGFGFWSHDISGFEGTAPNDVYKRWAAFGLLSTHSRLHGANSYRVPWLFGEEAVDVVRFFTEFKCTLMPYMYANAVYTHKTGVPVMRAMMLEFPQDIVCEDLERQYMLGDSILVAPIFKKNGDVDYYLPKGKWTNILSNKVVNGGSYIHENHGFMSLPLMAKENSIIALGQNNQEPDYDYTDETVINIFELSDKAYTEIYNTKGEKVLEVCAKNENNVVTIKLDGIYKNMKILMRNVFDINYSGDFSKTELGVCIEINSDEISFEIGE
ncbi:MAG: alpha-xylosidase [Clostridia bacterium]